MKYKKVNCTQTQRRKRITKKLAKELELPLGTVKAHIFRGRELLNKYLKDKIKNY